MPEEESGSLNEIIARVLRILTNRRWWILLPGCGITLVSLIVILQLPNRYTSEATLLVVQQQVPERYVVPNSTTDTNAVLQAMRQEVLSRTRLLAIIDHFGLYADSKKRLAPETMVEEILHDIGIEPVTENPNRKDFDALKISFVAGDPVLAQRVTSNLASLFINESLRTREEQSTGTTNFLHQQVEEKAKLLAEQEQRLSNFKMQHIGELPEQQGNNLGILTSLNSQLNTTNSSLSRAQEHRVYLETLLNAYKRPAQSATQPLASVSGGPAVVGNRALSPVETAQTEVDRLQSARAAMLAKGWTAQHPDVIKINRELARAEGALNRLKATAPPPQRETVAAAPSKAPAAALLAVDNLEDPAVLPLRSQYESNRVEIENLTKEENRLKAEIASYQSRLNQTPVREQEQASIARETEALRQDYANLQKKEQESQLATNLEKQQGGQQFRLVDAPNLPLVPSSPKRLKLSAIATAVGFGLGLVLALFLELRDTSFHTQKELEKHLAPPFVMGIPVLSTSLEERRQRTSNMLQWALASAMVLVVLAAEVYVYKRG